MRKLVLVAAILAVVGMVIPAFCADQTPASMMQKTATQAVQQKAQDTSAQVLQQATTAMATPKVTKGTVTNVDKTKKAVAVKSASGMEETFMVMEATKVTKGGKSVTVADILVDDMVTVTKKGDVVETIVVEVIPVK